MIAAQFTTAEFAAWDGAGSVMQLAFLTSAILAPVLAAGGFRVQWSRKERLGSLSLFYDLSNGDHDFFGFLEKLRRDNNERVLLRTVPRVRIIDA